MLRLTVKDSTVQPADFTLDFMIMDKEAEDYSSIFERYLGKGIEFPTGITSNTSTSDVTAANNDSDKRMGNEMGNNSVTASDFPKEDYLEPSVASAGFPLIPVAVVAGLLVLLSVCIAVVCLIQRNRSKGQLGKNFIKRESNRDEGGTASSDYGDSSQSATPTPVSALAHGDTETDGLLRSPACPGVTVKILAPVPPDGREMPDLVQPSIYGGEDRQSVSVAASTVPYTSTLGVQSYRDDGYPSTLYTPSTLYQYDDTGSIDLADPEAEFYAANRASCGSQQRLYHVRSAKMIDPDVLALYSSDESIPSMIDEKYATPLRSSVPSGLNRSRSQPGRAKVSLGGSQSTASLPKAGATPGLSLPPNSANAVNQYWI